MQKLLDTASLKVRLTLGIAAVAALGLGGLAAWTSMQMQHILVSSHKDNLKYIIERFPMDLKIYSEMVPLQQGAQRAINNLSQPERLIWIKDSNGELVAKSRTLNEVQISNRLLAIDQAPLVPQVKDFDDTYWLVCSTSLQLKNGDLAQLYLADNITDDQIQFRNLVRSLTISTIIAIAVMTAIIAVYIDRSMQPLKRISQLTSNISADKLDQAHISLEQAPTEVKELAETFDRTLARLSEAWEHQRELLSNVSHELRTPLTIISGYIQSILRRGDNLSAMQKEALTIASQEADRTVQLLQDLLDLARLDSGSMQFKTENIVLNDLIHDVAGMAEQYSHRNINCETYPDLLVIKADHNRLKQVLLNLIDNAVKYSEPETQVCVKLATENQRAVIQVCDRGLGIPLQQQGRIFERFFRVDEARNRAGGTGLGLSIVKTLVEGMGGNITLRSELNQGSIFTICFPLSNY
ncbi:MAG: HAMP domain-containing sensor histidine kinase [Cyanobacteria bacterium P01_G01_bin.39]